MQQETWYTQLNLAAMVREAEEAVAHIVAMEERAAANLRRVWTHPAESADYCDELESSEERVADLVNRLGVLAERKYTALSRQWQLEAQLTAAESDKGEKR